MFSKKWLSSNLYTKNAVSTHTHRTQDTKDENEDNISINATIVLENCKRIKYDWEYEFRIPRSKNICQEIVRVFQTRFSDDPRLSFLVSHFQKFAPNCLDEFSDFCILLKKYNTKIIFTTSRVEYSAMIYVIDSWDCDPHPDFKRKKFLGFL